MHLERYDVFADESHRTYEFLSIGPKGTIRKIVRYQPITMGIFNLAFGDWNEEGQNVEDRIRSNNLDRDKVLATVAFTVLDFLEYHPGSTIYIEGSTGARTRLYQMQIKSAWYWVDQLVFVKGLLGWKWEVIKREGNYRAFSVQEK